MTFNRIAISGVLMAIATTVLLSSSSPADAARIKSCLQVVPTGQIIMRYGTAFCR